MAAGMNEVSKVTPTVVFERDKYPVHHPVIHGVLEQDAIRSKDVTLVTTLCGLTGIGQVKARRAYNCGECKAAVKQAARKILDEMEEKFPD